MLLGGRMRLWFVLLALALAGPVSAQNSTGARPVYTDMASRVIASHRLDAAWRSSVSLERTLYGIPGNAGAVGVRTPTTAFSPRGNGMVIDVPMKAVIPWNNVAKGVARALPLVGTAVALSDLFNAIRCRETFGGLPECDLGQAPSTQSTTEFQTQTTASGANPVWSSTREAACQLAVTRAPSQPSRGSVVGNNCVVEFQSGGQWFPYFTTTINSRSVQSQGCSAITVNGQVLTPVIGPDGRCLDGVYEPSTPAAVEQRIRDFGDKSKAQDFVRPALPSIDFDTDAPTFEPPAVIQGGRETVTKPDGSVTVRDRSWGTTPTADGWEYVPRVVERDFPPGATIPPPGSVSDGTVTTGQAPAPIEIYTCGLPGKPPCKIDETGTPSSAQPLPDPDAMLAPLLGNLDTADVQFTWAFTLPANCQVLNVGAFGAQLVAIDLCEYQPMIHDIMTFVWSLGTIFICIQIVFRTLNGS